MQIIDNFMSSFRALQDYSKVAEFSDHVSEFDGVVYPLICGDIPTRFREEIYAAIEEAVGHTPEDTVIFMRRSSTGVPVPHKAHSDMLMGDATLLLYLNEEEDCIGGTSFLTHKESGISYGDSSPPKVAIFTEDQNNDDAWSVDSIATMHPNRAVIFDASRIHRAEPVGGFGDNCSNSRVVLTCFFKVGSNRNGS